MTRFSLFVAVAAVLCSSLIGTANAHGYTTISRNIKCKNGVNYACGSIVYEPQSLEAPKGFPGAGPADGVLASAGIGRFSPLNEQTLYRWTKTNVQTGPLDITWLFTANHKTTGYEYFITKPDWNPEAPLTRAQFDLVPFCTVNSGGAQPPFSGDTHTCNLPARSGYHVILGVWIIDDTAAAFYNMMDVQYGGPNPPPAPTTPAPITTSNPVASPPPTLRGTSAPTPTPPPPGALCSTGLILEAVDDCTAFVYCSNGAVMPGTSKVVCPSGLLFHNAAQVCDWDYNVDCASNPDPSPSPVAAPVMAPTKAPVTSAPVTTPAPVTNAPVTPAPITPSPVTTPAPVATTPAPTATMTNALCSSGQPLEPVENCAAFVYCVNGAPLPNSKVYCASGLLFNSVAMVCDWASNVDCN